MESWLTGKQKEVNETVNRVEQRKITAEESSKAGKDTSKKLTGETSNWKEDLETRKKRLEEKKEGDLAACESNCPKGSKKHLDELFSFTGVFRTLKNIYDGFF